jgi:predicted RND superfamily exporter protein
VGGYQHQPYLLHRIGHEHWPLGRLHSARASSLLESHGNRKEKVVSMLKTMGSSIFIGGITTFLGTLPLAFSSSSIFNTIFITFLGLVTLGASHGLILLPVILSLIGPEEHIGAAVTGGVAEGATQKAPKEEEDMERQDDTA